MLRWLTAGESHGRALMAICEGVPAGVEVATADIAAALARRRAGYGRGARMKFEQDEVELTGGVRHGRTLGGPVALRIANTEWPKWETVMAPDPVDEFRPDVGDAGLHLRGRRDPLGDLRLDPVRLGVRAARARSALHARPTPRWGMNLRLEVGPGRRHRTDTPS